MKKCIKCGKTKELNEFYVHKANTDGHFGSCKECCKIASKKNRIKNIDYYKKYDREKYKNDPRVKERHKKYRKTKSGKRNLKKITTKYRDENPEKIQAHMAVSVAIRNKTLIKKPCEVCGKVKAHAHHDDYSRPLDVRWLCPKHHKEWHDKHGEGKSLTTGKGDIQQ